jgi:HAD superfamily hydrolase (TIGR01509 family)
VYLGLIPGIDEVLSLAHQHLPLFAFTNSNPTHKSVWEVRYANELKPFQAIYVSSDLGLRKPNPEAFEHVAMRMGVQPAEVLFFDDSFENVEGAQLAGMKGVVVDSSTDVSRELSRLGIDVED